MGKKALVPAAFCVAFTILRTHLEDKTPREELDGYDAYARKTKYRLIPGLW